jgi:hypothetical protein
LSPGATGACGGSCYKEKYLSLENNSTTIHNIAYNLSLYRTKAQFG